MQRRVNTSRFSTWELIFSGAIEKWQLHAKGHIKGTPLRCGYCV